MNKINIAALRKTADAAKKKIDAEKARYDASLAKAEKQGARKKAKDIISKIPDKLNTAAGNGVKWIRVDVYKNNRFVDDTVSAVARFCKRQGLAFSCTTDYSDGSAGTRASFYKLIISLPHK